MTPDPTRWQYAIGTRWGRAHAVQAVLQPTDHGIHAIALCGLTFRIHGAHQPRPHWTFPDEDLCKNCRRKALRAR